MKSLIVGVIFALVTDVASGQKLKENEVPGIIKSAFAKAYPGVTNVKWEKEKEFLEAGFVQGKKEMSVLLDAAGTVVEEEVEIAKGDLPKAVQNTLARDYSKFKVEETAKITAKGVITYEAEVELGEESYDLIFESAGKLVKKIKKEEKEKD